MYRKVKQSSSVSYSDTGKSRLDRSSVDRWSAHRIDRLVSCTNTRIIQELLGVDFFKPPFDVQHERLVQLPRVARREQNMRHANVSSAQLKSASPPPAPGGRPPPARSRPARPNRPPVARSARRLWGCAGVWSRAASCRSPGARSQLALHKQKQNMYNFWLPNGSRATERRNIFKQTLHYLSKILFKPGSCLDASRVAWQLKFLGQIDTWEKIKTKFSLLIFKYYRLFRARFRNWFLMDRSDK